jgi:adenylosuccinate lyase
MHFAIIENNKVVNIIVADAAFIATSGFQSLEAEDKRIQVGTLVENGQFVLEESSIIKMVKKNLSAAKAKKLVPKLEDSIYRGVEVDFTQKEQDDIKAAMVAELPIATES